MKGQRMKELKIQALVEKLPEVAEFVDIELEKLDCNMKVQMQIDVAVEEIFVNIANYAYQPDVGDATIIFDTVDDGKTVSITFKDSGVPYNPLEKEDPDITLPGEQRPIGGLGIFMVKKSMDKVLYEHKDGQNVLTLLKSIK